MSKTLLSELFQHCNIKHNAGIYIIQFSVVKLYLHLMNISLIVISRLIKQSNEVNVKIRNKVERVYCMLQIRNKIEHIA